MCRFVDTWISPVTPNDAIQEPFGCVKCGTRRFSSLIWPAAAPVNGFLLLFCVHTLLHASQFLSFIFIPSLSLAICSVGQSCNVHRQSLTQLLFGINVDLVKFSSMRRVEMLENIVKFSLKKYYILIITMYL